MIIADKKDFYVIMEDIFLKNDYKIILFDNYLIALNTFKNFYMDIDIVIIDIESRLFDHKEFIKNILEINNKTKIIYVSDEKYLSEPVQGVNATITRPIDVSYLFSTLKKLFYSSIL